MIQKAESEPHADFIQHSSQTPHKLLFERTEEIHQQEFEAVLINYLGSRTEKQGKIRLTDFRIIFQVAKKNDHDDVNIKFDFPMGYISKCQPSSEVVNKFMVYYIQIITKFGFFLKLKSSSPNLTKISQFVNTTLNQYNSFGEKRAVNLSADQKCKKWEQICYGNQGQISEAAVYDNQAWKFMPTYPQKFKVPKPFVGKRNQHDRLVLLSYVHEGKKIAGLWKSGPGKPDPQQQKWVPTASKKQDHVVLQIKTKTLGSNKSLAQRMIQIDGPIQLRQSFSKFFIASCYQNEQQQQQQRWLIHVNASRWYEQVQILLSESFFLLQKICQGVNVTILSQWDVRGSQICALIQLLARPQSRTIAGFGKLVQRQFLHFGHYLSASKKSQRFQDKGIALIQFLECVYQIIRMYPLTFQFNQDFLTYIAIHIYSRKYGNFLYVTKAISELNQQKFVKYGSIWAKIQNSKQQFVNPYFVGHKQCDIYELKRNLGMKNFRLWSGFFLRDILMYGNNIEINQFNLNHRNILKNHLLTRQQTQILRNKLSIQHKLISEKKKRLKQLEQMQLD